jgi:amino acid transporter
LLPSISPSPTFPPFILSYSYFSIADILILSYALQWIVVLPLEIIAAALTIEYWNSKVEKAIFVTVFLIVIIVINLTGVKGYGEAEFVFAIVKVTAVVGFM